MKKMFFCIALSMFAGGAMAQNSAFYKAQEKMNQNKLEEAEKILEEAVANPKTTQLAKMYNLAGQVQELIFNPELVKAAQNQPFDTLSFCQHMDKSISYYSKSNEFDMKPDQKGRVKPKFVAQNREKMVGMLNYYNYAGMFMNALGNKEKSIEYFQKYVDMPSDPVFSKEQSDSIYNAHRADYMQSRFNLAYLYYQSKDWDHTIAACDVALKDTMAINDLYIMKLQAQGEKKDSAAWANTLVDALMRTGNTTFQNTLLYYYMQGNRQTEADALSQKIVADNPENKFAWFLKGSIEMNVKEDYPAARTSIEKALALDPDYQDALFALGSAYYNEVPAMREAGKLKFVGTNKPVTAKNKAEYEKEDAFVKERFEKAKEYWERLKDLAPEQPKKWASALQMVYSALGMKDKADEMDACLDAINKSLQ